MNDEVQRYMGRRWSNLSPSVVIKINKMSHDRIPQENDGKKIGYNCLLERASDEAGRILSSIQALAGTTSCKGVQIAGLKKWAIAKECWIKDPVTLGVFSDRGSENEVYMNVEEEMVYKLNDFRYADDNLRAHLVTTQVSLREAVIPSVTPLGAQRLAGSNMQSSTRSAKRCLYHRYICTGIKNRTE